MKTFFSVKNTHFIDKKKRTRPLLIAESFHITHYFRLIAALFEYLFDQSFRIILSTEA